MKDQHKYLGKWYKMARPDGWDFYTGKTINYREALLSGEPVSPPQPNVAKGLCSNGVLHASRTAEQCFIGAEIPCSLFVVEGEPAIPFDGQKAGFTSGRYSLRVVKELDPATHFKWRYNDVVSPLHPLALPLRIPTKADLTLLSKWASVWASVRDSMRDSVWASVRDSVWDSVWASMRASVGDSMGASVWDSVWDSVWASVGASVWDSMGASVWDSVWDSVGASMGAYVGWIFAPVVPKWKCATYRKGTYPLMASVKLWQRGLVPSFDGTEWRLHSGPKGEIVWQGKVTA